MRHGHLPTNRQMSRRECDDSEEAALCPVCREEETQWHALGRCRHPASCETRRLGAERIDIIIQEVPEAHGMRECMNGARLEPAIGRTPSGAERPQWAGAVPRTGDARRAVKLGFPTQRSVA